MTDRPPLLTICIPTHQGRRDALRMAIDSVLEQLRGDSRTHVEICVSDNASTDGTQEMLGEYSQEHADVLRYSRNASDLGPARNMIAAVGMARGDFCWLLGSDDVVTSDGVAHVIGLITAYPGSVGFTFHAGSFGPDFLTELGFFPTRFLPSPSDRIKVFEPAIKIFEECGIFMGYMSSHVFRRRDWLDQLGTPDDGIVAGLEHFAHTYLWLKGAQHADQWVWYPRKLVKGVPSALRPSGLRDVSGFWAYAEEHLWIAAHVAGSRSALVREWTDQWADLLLPLVSLQSLKLREDATFRDDLGVLGGTLRVFRFTPSSRRALPTLLTPHFICKAMFKHTFKRSTRHRRQEATVRLTSLPDLMPTRHTLPIACEVANLGPRTCSSLLRPTRLRDLVFYMWFDAKGEPLGEHPMLAPIPDKIGPGQTRDFSIDLATPWEPGEYELRIWVGREDDPTFEITSAPDRVTSAPVTVWDDTAPGEVAPERSSYETPGATTSKRKRDLRLAIMCTPRTGSRWLQHMLVDMYELNELFPSFPEDLTKLPALPARAVAHAHFPPDDSLRSWLNENGFRVITLARHPLDVAISVLRLARSLPAGLEEQSAHVPLFRLVFAPERDEWVSPRSESFLRYATSERFASLLSIVCEWWQLPDVIRVRFEDLRRDPATELGSLVNTIGVAPVRGIDGALASAAEEGEARNPGTPFVVVGGVPEGWKRFLLPDEAKRIAAAHAEAFELLGYTCDADDGLTAAAADLNWYKLDARSAHHVADVQRELAESTLREAGDLQRRLSDYEGIAPATLELAKNLANLRRRFPRLARSVRPVLRRLGRVRTEDHGD